MLTLLLLVLDVGANHPYDALAADDLAVFTNSANAAANFHDTFPYRFLPPQKGRTEHYMSCSGFFNPLGGYKTSLGVTCRCGEDHKSPHPALSRSTGRG